MTVAVFFGGKSCEHNISIITGVQALREVSSKHKVIPVYIDILGIFWTSRDFFTLGGVTDGEKRNRQKVFFRPSDNGIYSEKGKKIAKIDVALLCCHGLNGEDGSLQGLLQLSGIPFTGSGVLASACGMDKITMKKLFATEGLRVLPFVSVTQSEYKNKLFEVADKIKTSLRFPLIVKPSNLGSSIGISIAHTFDELYSAMETAFEWDNSIVVENALEDFTELNCAVLGRAFNTKASQIEQPVGWTDFLTYDDKYTKKTKGGGRKFPAELEDEIRDEVQSSAKRAFAALGCSGVARVDFLFKDGIVYVNEINTVPGALSNYLFAGEDGCTYTQLIEKLFEIAIEEKKEKDRLNYTYKSTYKISGTKQG